MQAADGERTDMKINPTVSAAIGVHLARAKQDVAKLEQAQRTAAVNTGGSWRGVNLGKRLTEARDVEASWAYVMVALDSGDES